MGNKTNATGMRIGITQEHESTWYANDKRMFKQLIANDRKIKAYLKEKLANAGLASLRVKRTSNKLLAEVNAVRPGVVIGKAGSGIQELNKELTKIAGVDAEIKVMEVKNAEASAKFVGQEIARQLASRIAPKVAVLRQIDNAKNSGGAVKGISVWVSGRIKGAEIARTEKYDWGSVPRHTLRADIEFSDTEINVPGAGRHGIKVWIYKGEKTNLEVN